MSEDTGPGPSQRYSPGPGDDAPKPEGEFDGVKGGELEGDRAQGGDAQASESQASEPRASESRASGAQASESQASGAQAGAQAGGAPAGEAQAAAFQSYGGGFQRPPRSGEPGQGEPEFVHEAPAPLVPPDEQRPPYVPAPAGAVFAPPRGLGWTPVTPRLTSYRRLFLLLITVPLTLLAVLVTLVLGAVPLAALCGAAGLAISVVGWILAELDKRSWGYCERADEIYITHGVLVRRLTVVSYGRIQLVDVTADVLEQSLGIATVRLSTAAATTDAWIPGLRLQDAIQMRDRLADRAAAASMGL